MNFRDYSCFESPDGRLSVFVAKSCFLQMVSICERVGKNETGGVLIGHYSRDHQKAIVLEATGPPDDSDAGTTWFRRGIRGLRSFFTELWNSKRHYYLGEWHYHPYSLPVASKVDEEQMREIATNTQYRCPEPILVIMGGNPQKDPAIAVHLCVGRDSFYRLTERR